MSDPNTACDATTRTCEFATGPWLNTVAAGDESGWKHLTRQLPISGQTFCGHSGHGLAGFWHGIWSAAAVACIGAAMARAIDVVIGMVTSDPSMASMPRIPNQR